MADIVSDVTDEIVERISEKFLVCRETYYSFDEQNSFREYRHAFGNIKLKYACPYVQDFMSRLSVLVYDQNYQFLSKNDPGPDIGFNISGKDKTWHDESWLQLNDEEYAEDMEENMYVLVEWNSWNLQIDSSCGALYRVDPTCPTIYEKSRYNNFIEWWEKGLDEFLLESKTHYMTL